VCPTCGKHVEWEAVQPEAGRTMSKSSSAALAVKVQGRMAVHVGVGKT